MRAAGDKIDRRGGRRAESRTVARPKYKFISGKDASKLALVAFQVRAGEPPDSKKLEGLRFEEPDALKAAEAFVRARAKSAGKRSSPPRRTAVAR